MVSSLCFLPHLVTRWGRKQIPFHTITPKLDISNLTVYSNFISESEVRYGSCRVTGSETI